MQDSLQTIYCGLQAGTIKGYKKDQIEAALTANRDYMNKLGSALAECQNTTFVPWEEKDCKGPCAFEFEWYVVSEECLAKMQAVFGVNQSKLYDYTKARILNSLPDELKNQPTDENKLYKNVCGEYLPLIKLVYDPTARNEFSSLKYRYVPPKGFQKFSDCFESETEMFQYLTFRLLKNTCATGAVKCANSYLDYDYILAMSQIRTVIKASESIGGLEGEAWQVAKEGLFTRLLTGDINQQNDAVNYIKNFKFGSGLRYTSNIVGTLMMPVTAEDVVGSLVVKLFSRGAVKVSARVASYFGRRFVQGAGNRFFRSIDDFKDAIARGENVFYVGKHTDITPRPTGVQSHHGVNTVWMDAKYSNYSLNNAPSVYMLNNPNHNATRGIFNTWRSEIATQQGVSITNVNYSLVTKDEILRLAERQFDAADVPKVVRDEYYKLWDEYLKTLTTR